MLRCCAAHRPLLLPPPAACHLAWLMPSTCCLSHSSRSINNDDRPDEAFTTERAQRAGRANAASGARLTLALFWFLRWRAYLHVDARLLPLAAAWTCRGTSGAAAVSRIAIKWSRTYAILLLLLQGASWSTSPTTILGPSRQRPTPAARCAAHQPATLVLADWTLVQCCASCMRRRVGLHILLLQQNIHSHATSYVQGIRVGEWWKDRLDCRQWGAHFPHVAGIAGQSNVGAQSVVLSGG